MKKAFEYLDEYKEDLAEPELTDHQYHWLKIIINVAREEAILEDRKNVISYLKLDNYATSQINGDNIFNASIIDLK